MSTEYKELERELETLIKEEAEIHNKITVIMDKMQEILLKSGSEIETKKVSEPEKIQTENTQSTEIKEEKKEETEKTISKPKTRRKVQRKTTKAKIAEEKDN